MKRDAFSCCHPAVNFLFFVGAFCMMIAHPAYVAAGMAAAISYRLLLGARTGGKLVLTLLPVAALIALINPLINTGGKTILFAVFGRPYTREALCYGAALAGMLLSMLLWFSSYNLVMTGDKFTSLFGNLIPTLSLLLVMVLRLVPLLFRKGKQISGARCAIGKGAGEDDPLARRLREGLSMLGCLTTWALEGSVTTADSMRSRGYGTARRTGFAVYTMTGADWICMGILGALLAVVGVSVACGAATAQYTPDWYIAPIAPLSFGAYCLYLLTPTFLQLKETVTWHFLRSGI